MNISRSNMNARPYAQQNNNKQVSFGSPYWGFEPSKTTQALNKASYPVQIILHDKYVNCGIKNPLEATFKNLLNVLSNNAHAEAPLSTIEKQIGGIKKQLKAKTLFGNPKVKGEEREALQATLQGLKAQHYVRATIVPDTLPKKSEADTICELLDKIEKK